MKDMMWAWSPAVVFWTAIILLIIFGGPKGPKK